jgi:Ribbon-helix-helix protein, copG family
MTKPRTNQRIVFYVTETEKKALDQISKDTGARASELMRRAFKQWLKGYKG